MTILYYLLVAKVSDIFPSLKKPPKQNTIFVCFRATLVEKVPITGMEIVQFFLKERDMGELKVFYLKEQDGDLYRYGLALLHRLVSAPTGSLKYAFVVSCTQDPMTCEWSQSVRPVLSTTSSPSVQCCTSPRGVTEDLFLWMSGTGSRCSGRLCGQSPFLGISFCEMLSLCKCSDLRQNNVPYYCRYT